MKLLSIIVTDDHPAFRDGVILTLKRITGVGAVSGAANGSELLEKLKTVKTDIVFLDIEMPVMNGIEAMEHLKRDFPAVKVVVFSMSSNTFHVGNMINKANGYLVKNASAAEIAKCLEKVAAGDHYFSPEVQDTIKLIARNAPVGPTLEHANLSEREIEVLKLICKDHSDQDIAIMLSLSANTVRVHRSSIYKKIGTDSLVGLMMFAINTGLFSTYKS